jgi:hypothetical protein
MSNVPFDDRWQLQHEDGSPVTDIDSLDDMRERSDFARHVISLFMAWEGFMDDGNGQD